MTSLRSPQNVVLLAFMATACSDQTALLPPEESDFPPLVAYDHWACHFQEAGYDSQGNPILVLCQDRETRDWERDFLNEWTSGLCAAAQQHLDPVINGGESRVRIDSQAADGDWHFEGAGLHVKDTLFGDAPDRVRYVLAHEAGHAECGCNDQEVAHQFAMTCLGLG